MLLHHRSIVYTSPLERKLIGLVNSRTLSPIALASSTFLVAAPAPFDNTGFMSPRVPKLMSLFTVSCSARYFIFAPAFFRALLLSYRRCVPPPRRSDPSLCPAWYRNISVYVSPDGPRDRLPTLFGFRGIMFALVTCALAYSSPSARSLRHDMTHTAYIVLPYSLDQQRGQDSSTSLFHSAKLNTILLWW